MYQRILYTSNASQEFDAMALFRLLNEAQIRNEEKRITGHLLFTDGQFTQCFEGPIENVEMLWQKINKDPRHHSVKLLKRHPIEIRKFPDWSMAFSTYGSLYVHGMKGFFPIDDESHATLVSIFSDD